MRNIVAFVANDSLVHYLGPFLSSFRRHMPDHPAVVIPYDDNVKKTSELADIYNIRFIKAREINGLVNEISQRLYRRDFGHLRKLHSFTLDADNVMLIDVDVIVLRNLHSIFESFSASTFDLAFGEETRGFVYSPEGLRRFPNSKLFSTGVVVFRPGRTDLKDIRDTLLNNHDEFMACRDPTVHDQPMLNYFIDRNGKRAISFGELDKNISSFNYYLRKEIQVQWTSESPRFTAAGREIALLHFAGLKETSPAFRFKDLLDFYRLRSIEETRTKTERPEG